MSEPKMIKVQDVERIQKMVEDHLKDACETQRRVSEEARWKGDALQSAGIKISVEFSKMLARAVDAASGKEDVG